jgi:5,10-methylenetetrahydrofolate reductase
MNIFFELNPPKIIRGNSFNHAQLSEDMQTMADRASQLADLVGGIHLTDSVLGIPRVSGITAAGYLQEAATLHDVKFSCSIRVRDRNFTSLCQAVSDAILNRVESLLVLMGDVPVDKPSNSGLKPSAVVRMLKKDGYDTKIKLDLSFPDKIKDPLATYIQNKLDAKPHSFVTQSISSLSDLSEIVDLAKPHGIDVAAVIMVPSQKNRNSASMIGLDWSGYEKNPADFIRQAAKIADRVLLTSPNSFRSGLELIKQLK